MKQADVSRVRREVVNNIGRRVKIKANKGRHKIDITEGIISETYPSIFLITIDDGNSDSVKTMTFSYTDVLTKDVQMMLCS
ncbi:Veg family protein [Anaerocolumna aminovalerica]|nr:Veg family protein [Anaerocolumna aminovalerica]